MICTIWASDVSSATVTGRHDLADLATVLTDKVSRDLVRADQTVQPPAALSFGPDLCTADKITFRNDADQLALGIDDRQPADVMLQHLVDGFDDGGVGADRYYFRGHDLVRTHGKLPGPAPVAASSVHRPASSRF